MKRLHINLSTDDLESSVAFYNELFAHEPTVLKTDYAKWMLDDPRVNFSLSTHGAASGVDHLGIEAERAEEFEAMRMRLLDSDETIVEQPDVNCCYASSSKAWVRDPNGVAWETFISHGKTTEYGDGSTERAATDSVDETIAEACCATDDTRTRSCCV